MTIKDVMTKQPTRGSFPVSRLAGLFKRSGNFQVASLGVAALPLLAFTVVATLREVPRDGPDPARYSPRRTAS